MNWEELKNQFKEIARMFTAVEVRVELEGKLHLHELELMVMAHKLSKLGVLVLVDFIQQSDRIVVVENDEGQKWLEPNPEFNPPIEEADTGVHEIPADDGSEL